MAYTSLYRKYRPDTFDKVIGQDHIVRTLKNQIAHGNVGHAYIFTGTRGTGKTSVAKIFARAVNCLSPLADGSPCGKCENCVELASSSNFDILEIDAASNNSVDQIRELTDKSVSAHRRQVQSLHRRRSSYAFKGGVQRSSQNSRRAAVPCDFHSCDNRDSSNPGNHFVKMLAFRFSSCAKRRDCKTHTFHL